MAINDNIDTMYDDDYAPFKALFNAQYSKDISKKIHSAYLNQAEKGRFTGVVQSYGYLKDPSEPYQLMPSLSEQIREPVFRLLFYYDEAGGASL